MYLHLIGNDPKFPKDIREKYEKIDSGNHYYVIVKRSSEQIEYTKKGFNYVVRPNELKKILESRDDWDGIIINGLLSFLFEFLPVLPLDLPIAYFIWGVEAYSCEYSLYSKLYAPLTKKQVYKLPASFRAFLSSLIGGRARNSRLSREVAKSFNIVCFPIKEEVELFVEKGIFPSSIRYHCANVGLGTDFKDPSSKRRVTGQNLLVGNSADPNNNHLDVFTWIAEQKIDLSNKLIIVPLSYGGNDTYKNIVIQKGFEIFGNKFVPLLEFMSKEEYLNVILSASYVLMNHYRQQAAGNIILSLTYGSSVYMHKNTSLCKGLKRLGFSIGDIASGTKLEMFDKEDINANRELARECFSKECCFNNSKKLLSIMKTMKNSLNS